MGARTYVLIGVLAAAALVANCGTQEFNTGANPSASNDGYTDVNTEHGCNPGTHVAANGGCDPDVVASTSTPDAGSPADAGTPATKSWYCLSRNGVVDCSAATCLQAETAPIGYVAKPASCDPTAPPPATDGGTPAADAGTASVAVDAGPATGTVDAGMPLPTCNPGTHRAANGGCDPDVPVAPDAGTTSSPDAGTTSSSTAPDAGSIGTADAGTTSASTTATTPCADGSTICALDVDRDGKADTVCLASTLFPQGAPFSTANAAGVGYNAFDWSLDANDIVGGGSGGWCISFVNRPVGVTTFTLVSSLKKDGTTSAIGSSMSDWVWVQNGVYCTSKTADARAFCASQGGGNYLFAVSWNGNTLVPAGSGAP